jgi:hypothetical protein
MDHRNLSTENDTSIVSIDTALNAFLFIGIESFFCYAVTNTIIAFTSAHVLTFRNRSDIS